jgi:DNA-binding NarL/FixJ family response regulator
MGWPVEGLEPSVTTNSPEFLVVEDHPMVMRTLRTYLQRVGTVLEAGTVQEGLRVFEQHTNLAGMLVDVNLPDGLGTDLIREIRRRDPVLPILMLTGSDERGWANEAHALGVEFVFKPIVTESLERFSARAVARASSGDDSLAAVVSELVSSHGLSPREVQVLTLSLGGTPRVALTDEMGVSDNTVKTTVRHLLRKTTADTLDDLVQYVMRAALQRRSAPETNGAAPTGSSRPPVRRAH